VPLVDVARSEGTPDPSVPQDHHGQAQIARRAGRARVRSLVGARWPLFAVLGVQAVLTLRLLWSNTAFQDEALYLRAGHLE